jgi:hypothetical protein
LSKESFQYPETAPIFKTLEEISQRSSVSRGRAFEDVIRASVAALAAETMEEDYFEAIKEHTQGTIGKRGVDLFGKFFGQTVDAISQNDHDVLGDIFQTSISYGENAFYMTPQSVSAAMSKMMMGDSEAADNKESLTIQDPCCGTGILLIEAAKENDRAELCGTDIDSRCADICAINLGIRSRYGWVICGNTLSRKVQYAYRIGSFFHEGPNGQRRGVIRKVPPEQCPVLPELIQTTKEDLFETIEQSDQSLSQPQKFSSNILEVPQWLNRLEPQLAAAQTKEVSVTEQPEPMNTQVFTPHQNEVRKPDTPSSKPSQKSLF